MAHMMTRMTRWLGSQFVKTPFESFTVPVKCLPKMHAKCLCFVFPSSPNLWSAFYFVTFIKSGLLENVNKK